MSDLSEYEVKDPGFVSDLIKSKSHVELVAQWLRSRGHDAKVQEVRVRDKVENMRDFSDNGDIMIGEHRVEVKQRKINFTSKEDFPYPTIIVDVAHTWDDAAIKPVGYILTNTQATCCLIVKGDTFAKWQKVVKWDRFKKRDRTFYECPIEHTAFFSMND